MEYDVPVSRLTQEFDGACGGGFAHTCRPSAGGGGSPGCDDGVWTPSKKTDEEMKVIGLRMCGLPFFPTFISILTEEEHPESSACMEQHTDVYL